MRFSTVFAPFIALTVTVLGPFAFATMQPLDMQNSGNSLARMAFDLKDLIATINESQNGGAMSDVFDEFDDIFDSVLSNISLLTGTAVVTDPLDVQLVYEAYSNFVQGVFELMDGVADSAPTFIQLDKQNEFRIPAAVRELSGVVDAYLFNMIGIFPSNSSYAYQSANQKSQVDTHLRRAVHSYHLATARTPTPYSNTSALPERRRHRLGA
ncbi:hypothetical protein P152DRAFT_446027 [Eremomyces bilateralis CBS 781.70]|uniref:Uncharacterized protein n=1 Tax=Eremomyces bilateralis CBS 781.70 TaxID=1392243 RepID=A0A6G1GE89_9PEZI|nr:uncharacterized protein P152DRAFT_446027 [Eremomyces bilateralis CBS 781.70]KAF1816363.1 hypothetical protein P152DRAFT_446027 [Eremomyces bilateralis CBS 781.70]